jgi:hypothetical protein
MAPDRVDRPGQLGGGPRTLELDEPPDVRVRSSPLGDLGENQLPASAAASASELVSATSASMPVVRSADPSWMITGTPSAVIRTSISMRSLPEATAASNAAIVFSGADDESPRCAMVRM